MKSPINPENILICPDCDLVLEKITVDYGHKLLCPRCSCVLVSSKADSVEKTMALAIAGLLLYIPANFLPLLTFDAAGLKSTGSIWDSWLSLSHSGFVFTGVMVLLTSILIPLFKLIMLFAVTFSIHSGRSTRTTAVMYRWYHQLDEWGMIEVYMIGILVTIVKMLHMAHIEYDTGFLCFIGLMATALSSSATMDRALFWEEIDRQASEKEQKEKTSHSAQPAVCEQAVESSERSSGNEKFFAQQHLSPTGTAAIGRKGHFRMGTSQAK
jgi:paraquat-inducible protein A